MWNNLQDMRRLFYTSYSRARWPFSAYQKVWCSPCYWLTLGDRFPLKAPMDEDRFQKVIEADVDRFKCAQNGDNLMIPSSNVTPVTFEIYKRGNQIL